MATRRQGFTRHTRPTMARVPQSQERARRLLILAIGALLVLGLMPVRYLGLAGELADKVNWVLAPISHPLYRLSRWLQRSGPARPEPPELAHALEERDRFQALYLREREENERLRRQIRDLQRGIELNPALPVRQLAAQVIRRQSDLSSGLLVVRRGTAQGVHQNTVAVVGGVDLVGRVERAGRNTSALLPITARGAPPIRGRIMIREPDLYALCELRPVEGGALEGLVSEPEDPRTGRVVPVERGQVVRLDDPTWPENAQMLVVGLVERVHSAEDQILRKIVTVRPRVDPMRISEVVLRITEPGASDGEVGPP